MNTTNDVLWNDQPWWACESIHAHQTADVCVIGLGASGLSAIVTLAQHGFDVIGVDAGMIGGGAAGSNGGFVLAGLAAFHHDAVDALGHHRATTLYQLTLDAIADLQKEEPGLRMSGSLRIAADDEEYADCLAQFRVMQHDGLPVKTYEGSEGRGILFPNDGTFQPLYRVRRLAQQATTLGARLFERSSVTTIQSNLVTIEQYHIQCKHVIVAVDGRLEQLFPQLRSIVQTTRLQMAATAPAHDVALSRPVYYRYGYDYWQQRPDGRIAIGGGRDLYASEEWGYNPNPTQNIQSVIEERLRTVVNTSAPITHRWGACVAYRHDDVRPFVGLLMPNVWACGAYSGTGNIVGCIVAKAISRTIIENDARHLEPWIN
ncbi:MAG: FAD-binding oxidoreductase [Chloroflexi bacterium]|nr:FAD-binding oxidoreductase [Chloroflexota bacterium]